MKKKRRIIGHMKVAVPPQKYTPEIVAQYARQAMDYLTPLASKMSPSEALVLMAMYADCLRTGQGEEYRIPEDEIFMLCHAFTTAWDRGLFEPNNDYPYTLEQTLEADGSDGEL